MKIKFEYKKLKEEENKVIEQFKDNGLEESNEFDTVIAIGGDGTLLYSINKYKNINNFILVNTGTLGYYDSCEKDDIVKLINSIKNNSLINTELNLLNIQVETNNDKYSFNVLNDMMLRSVNYKSTYFNLYIKNKKIEEIVGDGILISTSYGSSAYNLSLGGPIFVDDKLVSITPVNPLRNKNHNIMTNSILMARDSNIEIKPFNKTNDIIVVNDGILYKICDLKNVIITNKTRRIYLKSYKKIDFLEKIVEKII